MALDGDDGGEGGADIGYAAGGEEERDVDAYLIAVGGGAGLEDDVGEGFGGGGRGGRRAELGLGVPGGGLDVGFDGGVVGAGVGIGRGEVDHAFPGFAGALEVGGVGALVGENEGVEEGGEGVDVVAVGEDGGVEARLDVGDALGGRGIGGGAFDVVGLAGAALVVGDAFGAGLGGDFLGLLDALGVELDGVALALEGAIELDAGGVGVGELEVVERLIRVEHHLVVGAAAVGDAGLVGEQGAGLGADADAGGGLVGVDLAGGLVEGGERAGEVVDARGNILGRGGEQGLVGLGLAGGEGGGGGDGGGGDGGCRAGQVGEGGGAEDGALFEPVEDGVLGAGGAGGISLGGGEGARDVARAQGGVAVGGLGGVGLAAGEGEGGEEGESGERRSRRGGHGRGLVRVLGEAMETEKRDAPVAGRRGRGRWGARILLLDAADDGAAVDAEVFAGDLALGGAGRDALDANAADGDFLAAEGGAGVGVDELLADGEDFPELAGGDAGAVAAIDGHDLAGLGEDAGGEGDVGDALGDFLAHAAGEGDEQGVGEFAAGGARVGQEFLGVEVLLLEVGGLDELVGGGLVELGDGGEADDAFGGGLADGGEGDGLGGVLEIVDGDDEGEVGFAEGEGLAGGGVFLDEGVGVGAGEQGELARLLEGGDQLAVERLVHALDGVFPALVGGGGEDGGIGLHLGDGEGLERGGGRGGRCGAGGGRCVLRVGGRREEQGGGEGGGSENGAVHGEGKGGLAARAFTWRGRSSAPGNARAG